MTRALLALLMAACAGCGFVAGDCHGRAQHCLSDSDRQATVTSTADVQERLWRLEDHHRSLGEEVLDCRYEALRQHVAGGQPISQP